MVNDDQCKYELYETEDYVEIKPIGSVNYINSPRMREKMDYAVNKGKSIILDASQLEHIGSSGLATLVQEFKNETENNGNLVIHSINNEVNDLMHMTRLNTVIKICKNRKEAIDSLKEKIVA